MNFARLCSKLEGLSIETGKFYWMRMQGYDPNIIRLTYNNTDFIEICCHETFFQALLNCYFNDVLVPTRCNDRCNCHDNLLSLDDFIKNKYKSSIEDLLDTQQNDEVLKLNELGNDSSINKRYKMTVYMKEYVDAYLKYLSENNNIFECLRQHVIDKLIDFIQNNFNKQYEDYKITNDEQQYLIENFNQLIELHIKSNFKCTFSQPWSSAIYVMYE